jgi:hypothetical protein
VKFLDRMVSSHGSGRYFKKWEEAVELFERVAKVSLSYPPGFGIAPAAAPAALRSESLQFETRWLCCNVQRLSIEKLIGSLRRCP